MRTAFFSRPDTDTQKLTFPRGTVRTTNRNHSNHSTHNPIGRRENTFHDNEMAHPRGRGRFGFVIGQCGAAGTGQCTLSKAALLRTDYVCAESAEWLWFSFSPNIIRGNTLKCRKIFGEIRRSSNPSWNEALKCPDLVVTNALRHFPPEIGTGKRCH